VSSFQECSGKKVMDAPYRTRRLRMS